jgi:preprotein translocase subunit YajC
MTTTVPLFGMFLALASSSGQQVNPVIYVVMYGVIFAIFYFLIILPTRNRKKKIDEFLTSLKVGDKVITTGGIFGSIAKIADDSIQLQIAPNVRVEIARAAIVGYQGQPPVVDANT